MIPIIDVFEIPSFLVILFYDTWYTRTQEISIREEFGELELGKNDWKKYVDILILWP